LKIIFSDLHIGDGHLKDDFVYDKKFIKLLERNKNENLEIIFVGDCLELTDTYTDTQIFSDVETTVENFDYNYFENIYKTHKNVFNYLKELSKNNPIKYICGNHDYHFLFSEKMTEKLKDYMGNVEILPYYYDEEWEIFYIHGHQFDFANRFTKDENNKILPTFGEMLQKYMGQNFDAQILEILPEDLFSDYDNVSPQLDMFYWLKYVTKKYSIPYDLKGNWANTFINFMRTKETKKWLKSNFPKQSFLSNIFINKVGGIKVGEVLVRIANHIRVLNGVNGLLQSSKKLLLEDFLIPENYLIGFGDKEIFIPEDKIKGIVMGHNHKPKFYNIYKNKKRKFYANTGAWKHVVMRNNGINKSDFIRKNTLSYLTIEEVRKQLDIKLHVEQHF